MNLKSTITITLGILLSNLNAFETWKFNHTVGPNKRAEFIINATFFKKFQLKADGNKKIDIEFDIWGRTSSSDSSWQSLYSKNYSNTSASKKFTKTGNNHWQTNKKRFTTAFVYVKNRTDQNNYVKMTVKGKGRRGGVEKEKVSSY